MTPAQFGFCLQITKFFQTFAWHNLVGQQKRLFTLNVMNKKVFVLDGGLGSDLFINGGYDKEKLNNDPLWLARVTYENPDAIKKCHMRFIKAGSEVISTGTYQATVQGYMEHCGVSVEKAEEIIGSSVAIAKAAIAESKVDHKVQIAGSISCYGAILHDMSEYTGSYIDNVSKEELKKFHETNIRILVSKGIQLFAFETLPALTEAQVLVDILHNYPQCKAWISFTTKTGTNTSYGDPFTKVFETFCDDPQVIAVGTNCCDAQYTKTVLEAAKSRLGAHQSCIVYPDNRKCGEMVVPDKLRWASDVKDWLETGVVGWIGGCCLVTPDYIKEIRRIVAKNETAN